MNLKRLVFGFLFLCITSASFSQTKQYLYYFDKDLNTVESSKAVFYGTGAYEGDLLKLMLYNNLDKHLVMIEHFKDSSLQVSDGLFDSYYKNTAKELEGNYANGKEDGLWEHWDSAGHLIDSSIYENGEKIMQTNFYYTFNGKLSAITLDDFKAQIEKQTLYDDKGNIISQNDLKNPVDEDIVFTKVEVEAAFPGGPGAWTKYIAREIEKDIDKLDDKDNGTCIVKFIVGKDGKIRDVVAASMQGTKLAQIAVRAIIKGPDWLPALQNGRPVAAYRLQPVTFSKQN